MKPIDILQSLGRPPRLTHLLGDRRLSPQYVNEVVIEIEASTTSQVNVKNLVETQEGRSIADINNPIRVIVKAGVTVSLYAHSGGNGLDAITLEGIPSDKTVILENHGIIIGSGGLGSEGTYGGTNQVRNGSTGHGGSCVKMVDLFAFILINEGLMYGGKGVGANGSGGKGGNGTWGTGYTYTSGCSGCTNDYTNSTAQLGIGGDGGEWDGYGFRAWTRASADGGYTWKQKGIAKTGASCWENFNYNLNLSMSSAAGAGGQSSGAVGITFTDYATYNICYLSGPAAAGNGGSQGGAGGKGNVASGYGQGASGGAAGSTGGNGGAGGSVSGSVVGSDLVIVSSNGADGGGNAGSAGSAGSDGYGGGALTNATVTNLSVVNNGTILSGKDLDANRGGYLL